MTTFDEREAGFEAKFAHDADTEFRVIARANKLLGTWAAGKLGLSPAASDDYAREVVHAEFEQAGHAGVIAKVTGDLAKLGLSTDDVRGVVEATLAEARHQIMDVA